MRTRTQRIQPVEETPRPPLVAVPSDPKPKGGRGGSRPNAGRKPYREDQRKSSPAYVSMTDKEKAQQIKKAAKRGLTLSFFIREKLGLPVE